MAEIIDGKIILYPTRTIIEPYYERNSKIENALTVWDTVKHCPQFQAFIKDEVNNRLIIPTGFFPNVLLSMYPSYILDDKRKLCEDYMVANRAKYKITMKYDCRNNIQKEALNFLNKRLSFKTKIKAMQRYLSLKTGKGKTFCAIKYIVDNRERPIIFIDQDSLGQQWKERIIEYTDTTEDEIFYISGKNSIKKLMKMSSDDILKIKFFICCYRTLTTNIKTNNSSEDISKLFNKIKVTLKIFDEAHVEYMSIFKIDMISNLRSIYLSATPKRSDPNEDKVYQNMFKAVQKFSSESLEEKPANYHNIIIYKWNSKPTLLDQAKCNTKYGFSLARYCSYIQDEPKYDSFEEFLYEVLFNTVLANRKKKKIAILFGTLKLLDKVYNNLIQYCKDQGFKLIVNKFNGNTDKAEKMELLEKTDIILTTDKSFEKGLDVHNLQVVINTVPFSSDTKLTQTIGRLRELPNKEVIFIDINDIGFDNIKRQLYTKENKVYKKIGKTIFIKER